MPGIQIPRGYRCPGAKVSRSIRAPQSTSSFVRRAASRTWISTRRWSFVKSPSTIMSSKNASSLSRGSPGRPNTSMQARLSTSMSASAVSVAPLLPMTLFVTHDDVAAGVGSLDHRAWPRLPPCL